jgi:hypothetical protein
MLAPSLQAHHDEGDHPFVRQVIVWLRSAKDQEAQLVLLEDARSFLTRHFAVEESSGGFFDEVGRHAPRCARQVERLIREHREILAEIDNLRGMLAHSLQPAPLIMRAALTGLAEKLLEHEQIEQTLYGEIHICDHGGGD